MEFELGLNELAEENNTVKDEEIQSSLLFLEITEKTLIPENQSFLGLDISEHSTGICIYRDGIRKTYNSVLNFSEKSPFKETLLRRELKGDLSGLISGQKFDVIIIEDVVQGTNPATTRVLYAINTAIDELILDGVVECNEFYRVQNSVWKRWLCKLDPDGKYKGLNDKVKVEKLLESIGITESGDGYQDRLDATGMVVGYLLCKDEVKENEEKKKKRRVEWSDVGICYAGDGTELSYGIEDGIEERIYLKSGERYSKKKILDYLTDKPTAIFISSKKVVLGRVASEMGLPYIEGGGYFAFWVKTSKLKKYL